MSLENDISRLMEDGIFKPESPKKVQRTIRICHPSVTEADVFKPASKTELDTRQAAAKKREQAEYEKDKAEALSQRDSIIAGLKDLLAKRGDIIPPVFKVEIEKALRIVEDYSNEHSDEELFRVSGQVIHEIHRYLDTQRIHTDLNDGEQIRILWATLRFLSYSYPTSIDEADVFQPASEEEMKDRVIGPLKKKFRVGDRVWTTGGMGKVVKMTDNSMEIQWKAVPRGAPQGIDLSSPLYYSFDNAIDLKTLMDDVHLMGGCPNCGSRMKKAPPGHGVDAFCTGCDFAGDAEEEDLDDNPDAPRSGKVKVTRNSVTEADVFQPASQEEMNARWADMNKGKVKKSQRIYDRIKNFVAKSNPKQFYTVRIGLDIGYEWGEGWTLDYDEVDIIQKEISQVFLQVADKVTHANWAGSHCPQAYWSNGGSVYIHPMDISGYLDAETLGRVADSLSSSPRMTMDDFSAEKIPSGTKIPKRPTEDIKEDVFQPPPEAELTARQNQVRLKLEAEHKVIFEKLRAIMQQLGFTESNLEGEAYARTVILTGTKGNLNLELEVGLPGNWRTTERLEVRIYQSPGNRYSGNSMYLPLRQKVSTIVKKVQDDMLPRFAGGDVGWAAEYTPKARYRRYCGICGTAIPSGTRHLRTATGHTICKNCVRRAGGTLGEGVWINNGDTSLNEDDVFKPASEEELADRGYTPPETCTSCGRIDPVRDLEKCTGCGDYFCNRCSSECADCNDVYCTECGTGNLRWVEDYNATLCDDCLDDRDNTPEPVSEVKMVQSKLFRAKLEHPVAQAVDVLGDIVPTLSSGFHELFSKDWNGIDPSWAISIQDRGYLKGKLPKNVIDAAATAGLKINKRRNDLIPEGQIWDIYLPNVGQEDIAKAAKVFNNFAQQLSSSMGRRGNN